MALTLSSVAKPLANLVGGEIKELELTVTLDGSDTTQVFSNVAHGGPADAVPVVLGFLTSAQSSSDSVYVSGLVVSNLDTTNGDIDLDVDVSAAGTNTETVVCKLQLFFPVGALQDGSSINQDNNS